MSTDGIPEPGLTEALPMFLPDTTVVCPCGDLMKLDQVIQFDGSGTGEQSVNAVTRTCLGCQMVIAIEARS